MKISYVAAAVMLTCLLVVGTSARAQDTDTVVVRVPFEFVAGGATLPAGEYRVRRISPGVSQGLAISGYYKSGAFLLPLEFDSDSAGEPTLSFEHVRGRYFLSKIKTLNGVYSMPTPREMIMLGQANTRSPSGASSGGR